MQANTTNARSAGALRPNFLRDPNLAPEQRTIDRWFDTEAVAEPEPYTFGNSGRGIVRADGRAVLNFSINKKFEFGEQRFVQLRGDFLNAFNHADFLRPNESMGHAAFGSISSATEPRRIQLGLRIVF